MQQVDPFVAALEKWIEVFMHRSMRDLMDYARTSGLSMSQLGALFQIYHGGSSGVTGLGDKLGVTSSAASQLLERLVQQELIRRSEDPSDRRVKRIILTDKGLQVVRESMHARQRLFSDLSENLSDVEKSTIIAALDVLIDTATRFGRPAGPAN